MAKVINQLIDVNQTGAGPGPNKKITENIYGIDSIIELMEINDWNGYLVSFDQKKAFDGVEHKYTIQVLKKKMNFPPGIIRWIEIIYKDIKSTIQINGHLTKEIKIERSIRQGCSLSMTIYALIIEPLASNIRNSKDIKGINLPNRKEKCALFQHADDCSTIITEITDYDHLVKEFKRFGEVSGSKINESKTEILEIERKNQSLITR
ncbi:unnamed protein product [Mytilus coruscus]|uniref:Reverse transcriptase domain-containing protein n=1 Tax=Mytilus coruscus TaxID=42192 RepID=A0A6J8EHH1_MYTCO|nr:unnamed protein product [Mytilus coruscus]